MPSRLGIAAALALSLAQATAAPVMGTWLLQGTAPPGFVRSGTTVARVILSMHGSAVQGEVTTGSHHYPTIGTYSTRQHLLRLTLHTVKGVVHLEATLLTGNGRMVGTWSDSRGDDGGIVWVRQASTH